MKNAILYIILCVSVGMLCFCGCSDGGGNKELAGIDSLCESEPRKALFAQ